MWWQIRLADRRGLLTGTGLSRVQSLASEIMLLDESGVFERGRAQIRAALAAKPQAVSERVPSGGPDLVVDELTEANADDEGEGVTFLMPEDFSGADAMEVLAQMGRGGTVTADDFDG